MITKDGTLAFKVLEKQEIEVDCDQSDRWVLGALTDAAPDQDLCGLESEIWAAQSKIQIHLKGSRLVSDNEFQVEVSLSAEVPNLCARCGQPMMSTRASDFIQYFQLVEDEAEAVDSGDADLIYTTAAQINLRDLISERLVLIEPMVEQHPEGICQAPALIDEVEKTPEAKSNPFGSLKGLKFD